MIELLTVIVANNLLLIYYLSVSALRRAMVRRVTHGVHVWSDSWRRSWSPGVTAPAVRRQSNTEAPAGKVIRSLSVVARY